ncbi:MAG: discoidin domain-containing protein [Clostridia bacterium]|nr:discoidin domain-containing protein [Clostridia bacterium]
MKMFTLFLTVLVLILTLVACGNDPVTTAVTTLTTPDSTPSGTTDPVSTTLKPSVDTTPTTTDENDPATVEPTTKLLYPQFETPADDMSSKPLFFWNTTLDEMTVEGVREIVRESYLKSGYSGFGILPYWQEGYLSDQYFELYEAALDEGSKYGMKFSLYDENGFPSYTAGGLFAEKYPELTAKRLDMSEASFVKDGKIFLKIPQGNFMGAVAYNTETHEMIDISDKAVLVELPEFDAEAQPYGILASSTYDIEGGYEIDKAFDGKKTTRWNAYQSSGSGEYIIINYGKKTKIDSVKIWEDSLAALQRTRACDIEYWDADKGEWVLLGSCKTIKSEGVTISFDAVEEQYYRIHFRLINGDSATISEIEIYADGKKVANPPFANKSDSSSPEEVGYFSSSDYSDGYTAAMAFDGSLGSRWNAANNTSGNQWISAMFGKDVTVDSVYLSEAYGRIRSFSIQYLDGNTWKTCASGTTIGASKTVTFEAVTTKGMRLFINTTNGETATIYEMKMYHGETQVMVEEDHTGYKGSYLEYPVSGNNWKLMAFVCVSEGCIGMDYLSEEAVAGFIEVTYDAYYARFKKYFDNGTITSAFYDEPSFWPAGGLTAYGVEGARMWTDDFNEVFAEMFGKDENPILYYAAMWYDIGDKTTEARDKLNAVRTEMFAKHYIGQVNEWCEEHGIELMGHMLFEDQDNPVPLHGDLMYCFKYQACPTVDVINGYGMTEDYYKIISSSAYNWDHAHVGVECYGAIWNMPVNVLYKAAMDLFAKGINVMVPHAVWYSSTQNVVYPPELSYRTEPYASELPKYNEYISRLQTMLQEGRHVADIAVLYPIDTLEYDYNFNKGYGAAADSNYIALTNQLSERIRLDFTYLHPSVLDEKVTVNGSTLHLDNENNYEDYKIMILPSIRVIAKSNLEKIYDFYKNGGIVIAVGTLPTMATETGDNAAVVSMITEMFGEAPATASAKEIEKTNDKGGKLYHITQVAKLAQVLKKAYTNYDVSISTVQERNGHFTYIHKVLDERNIYFFANSSDIAVKPTVTLRGEYDNLEVWDPMTGEKKALAVTVKDGKTTFTLDFAAVTSLFVVAADPE